MIGTSLFADGAAAVLVGGDRVEYEDYVTEHLPAIIHTQSTLMDHSLDVMGWDIRDNGLYVVFAKSIPSLVETWLKNLLPINCSRVKD